MRIKSLIFLLFALTLLAIGMMLSVVLNSSPQNASALGWLYASTFFTFMGLIFLGQFIYLYVKVGGMPVWRQIVSALRVAFIFGVFVDVILLLQSQRLLNWATFCLILILTVATDIIWRRKLSYKHD